MEKRYAPLEVDYSNTSNLVNLDLIEGRKGSNLTIQ